MNKRIAVEIITTKNHIIDGVKQPVIDSKVYKATERNISYALRQTTFVEGVQVSKLVDIKTATDFNAFDEIVVRIAHVDYTPTRMTAVDKTTVRFELGEI